MRITKRFLLVIVAAVVCLSGCHKSPTVTGKWVIDPAFITEVQGKMTPGFMTGFASTFKYEFKDGGKFSGSMSDGTYTLDGLHLAMTTTTIMGKPVSDFMKGKPAPQMEGELAEDGSSMTLTLPSSSSSVVPAALTHGIKMVRDKS